MTFGFDSQNDSTSVNKDFSCNNRRKNEGEHRLKFRMYISLGIKLNFSLFRTFVSSEGFQEEREI